MTSVKSAKPYILLLLSMNLAGLIGLNFEATKLLFQLLTPFHLIATTAILLWFHSDKNRWFIIFCIIAFGVGYGVEVIGVNTALLFGHYRYLHTLGPKLFNVPLLIGLNWLLLTYIVGFLCFRLLKNSLPTFLIALIAAFLMTAFDYIVEPTAMRLEMWDWYGQQPPLSNYVGWLIVSFFLQLFFVYSPFRKENPISYWVFVFQVVFFGVQYFLFN